MPRATRERWKASSLAARLNLARARQCEKPPASALSEEPVREGREESAHDEDPDGVVLDDGHAVVLDVLGHRESESDHRRVDDAVGHVVELVALPEEEYEEDERFGRLLDDGRGDDHAIRVGRRLVPERADQ